MTDTLEPAPVQPEDRRWKLSWIVAGSAGALITIAVILIIAASTHFTMHGTFTTSPRPWSNPVCSPYSSPGPGNKVTVTNPDGVVVASSMLDEGTSSFGYRCVYTFTVHNVPTGENEYTVHVGQYSGVAFTEDQAQNPNLKPQYDY